MSAVLEAETLSVALGGREVLRGVDFTLRPHELVGLIGPNGAGKTTLLRTLAGLLTPKRGALRLWGEPLASLPRRHVAARLAYLPQGGGSYWPVAVADLVMLGRLPHRRAGQPKADDVSAVERALTATGTSHLRARPVTELSGGERMRVLLARALAGEPEILLADEPVSGLDPYHRLEVMEHLQGLARAGRSVVAVLHDLTLAAQFCDRLVLLDAGGVVADGAPDRVLTAERLAQVYHVEAQRERVEGAELVVPWRRLADPIGGERRAE